MGVIDDWLAAHDAEIKREVLQDASDAIGRIISRGGEVEFRDGLAEAQCAILTMIYAPKDHIADASKMVSDAPKEGE